jgi:hypothetical protein
VFYTVDPRVDEQVELYSVPIAGPFSAAERLNPDLPSAGDVTFYRTDGSPPHVLFLADSGADEKLELWISDGMVLRGDFEEGNSSQWSSVVP